MDLKHLTDQTLWNKMDLITESERELLTVSLHHLREIDRRRLFAAHGYSSLHDYAIRHLKHSSDQADRRIKAMRLLRDLPEIEEKIDSGKLTLTHLGVAQNTFQREKKAGRAFSIEKKKELIEKIAGTSTREAERLSLEVAPKEFKQEDRIRLVSSEDVEIKFHAKIRVREKLERLQGLLAHQNLSMADLIEKLCDLGLEHLDPGKPKKKDQATAKAESIEVSQTSKPSSSSAMTRLLKSPGPVSSLKVAIESNEGIVKSAAPRKLSKAQIYREVWRRDQNRCRTCGSYRFVQKDHIVPLALSGEDTLENMRLLCRSCNQRAAIEKLGLRKMERYLNRQVN